MREKKSRSKSVVIEQIDVLPDSKLDIKFHFESKKVGKVVLVFKYVDEVELFNISELTY